jgi:hypothetical protein
MERHVVISLERGIEIGRHQLRSLNSEARRQLADAEMGASCDPPQKAEWVERRRTPENWETPHSAIAWLGPSRPDISAEHSLPLVIGMCVATH